MKLRPFSETKDSEEYRALQVQLKPVIESLVKAIENGPLDRTEIEAIFKEHLGPKDDPKD